MPRILGLDYGTRRVGAALSDPGRSIAFPVEVYSLRGPSTMSAISASSSRRMRSSGSSSACRYTQAGARATRRDGPHLRRLADRDHRPAGRLFRRAVFDGRGRAEIARRRLEARQAEGPRDQLAAQIMLQGYLDAGCPETGPRRLRWRIHTRPTHDHTDHRLRLPGPTVGWLAAPGRRRVLGTVRSPGRAAELAGLGIEPVIADVLQPDSLKALPRSIAFSIAWGSIARRVPRCEPSTWTG